MVGTGLLTYADVLDKVARISNHFADRKVPPRSKVFLNFTDPDLRLVVTLACLHYRLIPFILVDPDQTVAEVDHDIVIGATNPYRLDIPLDLVIDRSVLEGQFSDPVLREFPDIDDEDILQSVPRAVPPAAVGWLPSAPDRSATRSSARAAGERLPKAIVSPSRSATSASSASG